MHSVLQDLRYCLRALVNNPGFTVVAVLTLALGIGANTAIFSYVDATWLRPLPVHDADRLVKLYTEAHSARGIDPRGESSYLDFLDLRSQAKLLEDVVAYEHRGALLHRPGEVLELEADTVSPNYFTALGVPALLGRTFTESDTEGGRFPVVISYAFWREQFGADPAIVGKEIHLSNGIVNILGVMPREFRGIDLDVAPSVWIPAPTWEHIAGDQWTFRLRGSRRQTILGRLRHGVSLPEAQAEVTTIAARLAQTYRDSDKDLRLNVERLAVSREGENRRQGLLLLEISAMVLLIACANVVNLQLARAESRRREFATRLALGGSSGRLLRQVLTESLLLAALGLGLALVLADWCIQIVPHLFASSFAHSGYDFRLDGRVLLFTIAAAVLSVVFGIVPGLRASRVDMVSTMKGAEITFGHQRRLPLRDLLVAGQVAMSVLLLVGAGLLMRTLFKVQAVDPGFNTRQNMLLVSLVPGLAGYEGGQQQNYYSALVERVQTLPGVEKTALAVRVPFAPFNGGAQLHVLLPGMTPPPDQPGYPVSYTMVGPEYFSTIGTRLLQGREFTAQDNPQGQPVAIVNRTMASRFWPGDIPVGRPLRVVGARSATDYQVVGVVEDAKWTSVTEPPRPIIYLSMGQKTEGGVTLLLRTQGDPAALIPTLRQELIRLDKNVPMTLATTLKKHLEYTLNSERSRALLTAAFGLLGLSLAAAGLYGVLSYFITRRTSEIGIRMALGAPRPMILGWVLRRGARLVGAGMIAGMAASLALARTVEAFLFGIRPTDPLTLAAVLAVLAAVAFLAIYIPARRASGVDPMCALREN